MSIFRLPPDEAEQIEREFESLYPGQWRYVHSVDGIGPDGMPGTVDVVERRAENWDDCEMKMRLNGKAI